jgi:hypothetical protein
MLVIRIGDTNYFPTEVKDTGTMTAGTETRQGYVIIIFI